jgi:hypothetical protein
MVSISLSVTGSELKLLAEYPDMITSGTLMVVVCPFSRNVPVVSTAIITNNTFLFIFFKYLILNQSLAER